ncbi:glycosyltransferase [Solwaraspora sp. WMMD1047]|uniref:glycosyltransferase family 2 protein n=1 Tax=Solwaraspora sp. WMMD1047 TaxID=3016102 RepID=UPI002417575F|nr:glycosyltransferase [Solwaraspora sp. WMMD1047]MDG4830327.1 glycosyltransferase [Solwaraspora sp. WMMD1047]
MNHWTQSPTTVVIPCHSERRLHYLVSTVESARSQNPAPAEIVVVVDHNPAFYQRLRRDLPGVTVLENQFQRGVSGTRNTGARHAITPLVAFLDDDVLAHRGWLAGLIGPFADTAVVGTGGGIVPRWETSQPTWFPDEFLWAVGGSYAGQPVDTAPVRNVWSGSMAVRREAFLAVGGFRTDFGKVGDRSRPEDTEFCLRVSRRTGGHWMYVPSATISHPVQANRATWRYFVTRCYHEGRGKVLMARLLGDPASLGAERGYLRRALPLAVLRGLADTLRGRGVRPALRSGAVLVGLAAAAVGALAELLAAKPATRPVPTSVPVGRIGANR